MECPMCVGIRFPVPMLWATLNCSSMRSWPPRMNNTKIAAATLIVKHPKWAADGSDESRFGEGWVIRYYILTGSVKC